MTFGTARLCVLRPPDRKARSDGLLSEDQTLLEASQQFSEEQE